MKLTLAFSLNRHSLLGCSIFHSTRDEDNVKLSILFTKYFNCIKRSFSFTATTWTFSNKLRQIRLRSQQSSSTDSGLTRGLHTDMVVVLTEMFSKEHNLSIMCHVFADQSDSFLLNASFFLLPRVCLVELNVECKHMPLFLYFCVPWHGNKVSRSYHRSILSHFYKGQIKKVSY